MSQKNGFLISAPCESTISFESKTSKVSSTLVGRTGLGLPIGLLRECAISQNIRISVATPLPQIRLIGRLIRGSGPSTELRASRPSLPSKITCCRSDGRRLLWGRFIRFMACSLALLALPLAESARSVKLPAWVKTAAETKDAYEKFDAEANALVLRSSLYREYKGRGVVGELRQEAVHIKTRDEKDRAIAQVPIVNRSQRLKRFDAWLIYPSGNVESFNKKDMIEVAQSMDALFSEAKAFVLDRSSSVRGDVIFAYEYELEEETVFLQLPWTFQDSIPTLYSRVEIKVPKGWTVVGQYMNETTVTHTRKGDSYIWEAADLPLVKDEEYRPPSMLLFSQVGITLIPSESELKRSDSLVFDSWKDVAKYGDAAQVPKMAANEKIVAKVQELTSGAASRWEKIKSICEYTQSVNYVSITIDLNAGGGYEPHAAEQVFERHYGDCKDMTVLTRSMLEVAGIESFAVLASIGKEAYVHDQWASPHQFNHCIVGIAIDDELDLPAIIKHEGLGNVLVFDPTQRYVPVGTLPQSLQGTKILVSSDKSDSLNLLPVASSEGNLISRTVSVAFDEKGNLNGVIKERLEGTVAEYIRAMYRNNSEEDFRKHLRDWIATGTRKATIEKIVADDNFGENRFELEISFNSPFYARDLGNRTMIFRPVFLGRRTWVPPDSEERQSDYMSIAWKLEENLEFKIPAGARFDGDLKPFNRETSFGQYALSSKTGDDRIVISRNMSSQFEVIPASRYGEVVEFYEKVSRSDSSRVAFVLE